MHIGAEAVRPLKFLNDSERAFIGRRVEAAHAEWRDAWTSHGASHSIVTQCAPAAEGIGSASEGEWLAFGTAHGVLYVVDAPHARTVIAATLSGNAGDKSPPLGSIAAEVTTRALQDLVQRIASDPSGPANPESVAPPAEIWLPASGAAAIGWSSSFGGIRIVLDQRLVAYLLSGLTRPARRAAPLVNPQHCLGRQPVEVRVWLGNADLDLALFQTLAVNDVIQLDSRVDEPLRLTVAGREALPRAFLGKADAHKAIRLTGQPPHH